MVYFFLIHQYLLLLKDLIHKTNAKLAVGIFALDEITHNLPVLLIHIQIDLKIFSIVSNWLEGSEVIKIVFSLGHELNNFLLLDELL